MLLLLGNLFKELKDMNERLDSLELAFCRIYERINELQKRRLDLRRARALEGEALGKEIMAVWDAVTAAYKTAIKKEMTKT
jgi:hypothetical protein